MATVDNFLTDSEIKMHDELHEWCDCNRSLECDRTCPFYTEDNEKDPNKMHWCHCNYIELNDKPHPAFIDALHRDYKYYYHKLKFLNKPTEEPVNTPVNHPEHYNQGGIECIDAMISAFGNEAVAHFCIVNAFKYVWRASDKNGMEDIDKAIWYLNKFKELTANR